MPPLVRLFFAYTRWPQFQPGKWQMTLYRLKYQQKNPRCIALIYLKVPINLFLVSSRKFFLKSIKSSVRFAKAKFLPLKFLPKYFKVLVE